MISGIYKITSPVGKCYIGSSIDIPTRLRKHREMLQRRAHHSPKLQSAWDKHDQSKFIFSPIIRCSKHDLLFFEQRAIDILSPAYNICPTAANRLGMKDSATTRAKKSAALRGRPLSVRARQALIQSNKLRAGSPMHENTRVGLLRANLGRVCSLETRKRIGASNRDVWKRKRGIL